MGWTYGDDWRKATDVRDHLRRELGGLLAPLPGKTKAEVVVFTLIENYRRGIVKDALVAYGHRYYAAWRPGDGTTTIAVCLLNHGNSRGEPDTDSWGYKDMSESVGPCQLDCPLSILNLATDPPPNTCAKEWRAAVRNHWLERRVNIAIAAGLAVGSKVYMKSTKDNPFTVTSVKPLLGYGASGNSYRLSRTRIERVEVQ